MIFGNPHKFAILADCVNAWTEDGGYLNGVFHFIIDSQIFPEKARVATLSGEVFCFDRVHPLVCFPENDRLFHASPSIAFKEMMDLALPQEVDASGDYPAPDERYKASTYNLEDGGAFVFSVSYGDKVRILGAQLSRQKLDESGVFQWEEIFPVAIHEVLLSRDEISSVVSGFMSSFESGFKYHE
ncbi:immunity 42 family protein [Xanthomonas oryzae]|uniref:immunity 42 family protein n=1 Tax=Xanthomonas oryzae TaxID=347 RepID=UPI0011F15CB0|nr:immunity 42 family protein [Xanthomonas oryzae]UBB93572.1 immunity 42 family protein [Xanthomonas oryzae pv. oryzicola]WGY41539.1 hypothetical protein HED68_02835 [Xanthomonas oryzae pv. oryzicola]